ncbi:hypothetical protein ACRZXV_004726 [Serratia liquefaciens]
MKATADYWRKVKSGELPAPSPNDIDFTIWTAEAAIRRIAELEAKLATPVRLPDSRQCVSGDRYQWSDGVHNYRQDTIVTLREQGFTVGDE